jgi:GDPmannose 4,6-dehydratase
VQTAEFAAVGATSLLEAIRIVDPSIRFYQASSSEIFGDPAEMPQTEETPLAPVTPYGVAKAYAHFSARSYRHRYGLYACSGILYNHESPRRPLKFLPRKVAHGAAAIALGLEDELVLGELDATRDWGYAGDYVRAMWLMVQQDEPDDYVISSGEGHSVRELVESAFVHVDLDWQEHVRVDPALQRGAAELHRLVGNPAKARAQLGWKPEVDFTKLVHLLVDADLARLQARATSMERR